MATNDNGNPIINNSVPDRSRSSDIDYNKELIELANIQSKLKNTIKDLDDSMSKYLTTQQLITKGEEKKKGVI